jgi:tetratricopeptide (TPR) repeat protein
MIVGMPEDSEVFSSDPEVLEEVVAYERRVLGELPAERTDETDEARARAFWRLGEALFHLRRRSEALAPLEEAEHAAALIPEWELIWLRARCIRATCLLGLKRWAEVADLTEKLVDVGDWLDEPYYVHIGLHARAVALESLDRWQDAAAAAAALRESLPVEHSPRTRVHLREALLIQAWVLTDTLDGDVGAIEDGDVGGERPNDQRVVVGR